VPREAWSTAGFPQIYIVDSDRNVVEISGEKLDSKSGKVRKEAGAYAVLNRGRSLIVQRRLLVPHE
jgi:hypothetical protein